MPIPAPTSGPTTVPTTGCDENGWFSWNPRGCTPSRAPAAAPKARRTTALSTPSPSTVAVSSLASSAVVGEYATYVLNEYGGVWAVGYPNCGRVGFCCLRNLGRPLGKVQSSSDSDDDENERKEVGAPSLFVSSKRVRFMRHTWAGFDLASLIRKHGAGYASTPSQANGTRTPATGAVKQNETT